MSNKKMMVRLIENNACKPARSWIGERAPEQAVAQCPRGAWLIWGLRHAGVSITTWRRIALAEADAVAHLDPTPEGALARESARAVLASDTPETRATALKAMTATWAVPADKAATWAAEAAVRAAMTMTQADAAASAEAAAANAANAAGWASRAAADAVGWVWRAAVDAAVDAADAAADAASADRIRAIITSEERARLIAWLGGES